MSAALDLGFRQFLGDSFSSTEGKNGWDGGILFPSAALSIFSFEIGGKICQRNPTRIDRTIQKCCARKIDLVVSYDDAWVKMAILALSARRAQFDFSTQGIVTHSQAQGSEAGAQPAFSWARVLSRQRRLTSRSRGFARHRVVTRPTKMHSKSMKHNERARVAPLYLTQPARTSR